VREAKRLKIRNFSVLPAGRIIPPAMKVICEDKNIPIDGFICPGHVSAIIGLAPYAPIVEKYRKGCVVAGFEPADIVVSLYVLLLQIKKNAPALVNTYTRVVKPEGNPQAVAIMNSVFTIRDAPWRGIGTMKRSGLFFRKKYAAHDASRFLDREFTTADTPKGCLCAEVIKGKIKPFACGKFGKTCSPRSPLGPCMVSFEGACRIYYEYAKDFDTISPA
jgi:hydrogenase expression/formation protein HypD